MACASRAASVRTVRILAASGIAFVSAVALAGCGQGAGLPTRTGTVGTITRTLPAATRTGGVTTTAREPTTASTTTAATEATRPTVTTTTQHATTTSVTLTQIQTTLHVQTKTEVVVPTTVVTTTTAGGVNTTAVVAAGAAAAAASQKEEPQSTPWGWVAFGILAAGLAGVGIFWFVRRRQDKKPSVP
jgi:hypothetical protein